MKQIFLILVFGTLLPASLAALGAEGAKAGPPTRNASAITPGEVPLKLVSTQFEPVGAGKNVVAVRVRNLNATNQILAVYIQTRASDRSSGWGRTFYFPVQANQESAARMAFKIPDPYGPDAPITLRFYSSVRKVNADRDRPFLTQAYRARDLPSAPTSSGELATADQAEAAGAVLAALQSNLRERRYDRALSMFTADYREAEQVDELDDFIKGVAPDGDSFSAMWDCGDLLELTPKSVRFSGEKLKLEAARANEIWRLDLIRQNGEWKIDWIAGYTAPFRKLRNWPQWVLPTLQKRQSEHFDIYYANASTAEAEIEQIIRQREEGLKRIVQFAGVGPPPRITLLFFEDANVKRRQTGHEGEGWATGNMLVEVYNPKTRLNPYHEATHVVMRSVGDPPALFNEGLATYLGEHLAAADQPSTGPGLRQRAAAYLNTPDWMDLERLIRFADIGPAESHPQVAYPLAGSFVQFLVERYDRQKFLETYAALRESEDGQMHQQNLQALQRIYGKSLAELNQEWKAALAHSSGR